MSRQPTIRDVAERAGVSHQTVSRVINGHDLVSASVEEHTEADERAYLRLMLERRVEGLIVARPRLPISTDQVGPPLEVPLVAIASSESPGLTVVDVDNRRGGLDAVSFLVARGHTRIATITGPTVWPSGRARLEGYRDALGQAGIVVEPSLVEQASGWGLEDGQAAMTRLLARRARFTALFAYSDLIAIGAIRELRAARLRVPEDVSVVGYDDIPVAAFLEPPLTTVSQPMREVGERAASLLLGAIAGAGNGGLHLLPVRLVVRASVVPPQRTS